MSTITVQFSRWTAIYLPYGTDQALASLQAYIISTVIPFSSRMVRFCADEVVGGNTDKYIQAYCLKTGKNTEIAAINIPLHISVFERAE